MENFKSIRKHFRPIYGRNRHDILQWWAELITAERYPAYAILLTTPLQPETSLIYGKRHKEYAEALDALSGPFVAMLVLTEEDDRDDNDLYAAAGRPSHVYRFADAFDISYSEFPTMLFFTDISSSAYVKVSLKGISPDKLIDELQGIFASVREAVKRGDSILDSLQKYIRAKKSQRFQESAIDGLKSVGKATLETVLDSIVKGLSIT